MRFRKRLPVRLAGVVIAPGRLVKLSRGSVGRIIGKNGNGTFVFRRRRRSCPAFVGGDFGALKRGSRIGNNGCVLLDVRAAKDALGVRSVGCMGSFVSDLNSSFRLG